MNFENYFKQMICWKQLPAYRMEPRIDSWIGYYLPEILEKIHGIKVKAVIPEFPLRKGTLDGGLSSRRNQSTKVDFFVHGHQGENLLIEMKSDSGSGRDVQDQYLLQAQKVGMRGLVEGIRDITAASSFKKKYAFLKEHMMEFDLIDDGYSWKPSNDSVQILYILPNKKKSDGKQVIDFIEIADVIEQHKDADEFDVLLAGALRAWSDD
jgi:hypothetical protein